jgi:hypothetical protein
MTTRTPTTALESVTRPRTVPPRLDAIRRAMAL